MNRVVSVSLVAFCAGCGVLTIPADQKCATKDSLQCGGDVLQLCDGAKWVTSIDCAATTPKQICVPASKTQPASCVPPGGLNDSCDLAYTCAQGLSCIWGICQQACTPNGNGNGTECGTTDVCIKIDATNSVCVPKSNAGQLCYDDAQCTGLGQFCEVVRAESTPDGSDLLYVGACAAKCPYSEINKGHGSCDGSLYCVASVYTPEMQMPEKSCSCDSDCDVANGYKCVDFSSKLCARSMGVCGNILPMYSSVPAVPTASTTCAFVDESATDLRRFCGFAGGNATARPVCLPIFDDDKFAGICIAVCSTDSGVDLQCGTDTAGVQYQCVRPASANPGFPYDVQQNAGVEVTCNLTATNPDAPCNTADGYHCENLTTGAFCALPSKICKEP